MAHPEQFEFVRSVKDLYPYYFSDKCVVEIGSLNINGSVRRFFDNCIYIGVDVAPGHGVDVVSLGHEYNMPDGSFDVVISCECLEHDQHWSKTFSKMIDLCKSGSLVIMSCATTGRKEHGTGANEPQSSPLTVGLGWDYYRNLTEQDFSTEIDRFSEHTFKTNDTSHDLYFYGFKR